MPAIAEMGYVKAQLQAAEEARLRLEAHAVCAFGAKRGPKIIDRVQAYGDFRLKQENPGGGP